MLIKFPAPAPSDVLSFSIEGSVPVLQHTPLESTVPQPSLIIVPPQVAVVPVIFVTSEVVIVGTSFFSQAVRILIKMKRQKTNNLFKHFMCKKIRLTIRE